MVLRNSGNQCGQKEIVERATLGVDTKRFTSAFSRFGVAMARFLPLLLLIGITATALAQMQPVDLNLDTGIKPNEAFDRAEENVNIGSGNLNIQIPLVQLPGRNGHDFALTLTYNSQNWTPIASLVHPGNYPGDPSTDYDQVNVYWQRGTPTAPDSIGDTGWQLNIPTLYATAVIIPPPACPNGPACGGTGYSQSAYIGNFVLVTGDGTKYSFQNARLGFNTTTTTCSSGCSYSDAFVASQDYLVDFDTLGSTASPVNPVFQPASGQGVMLDLTNVANGSGAAIVRFRDGSQILFPIDWFFQSPNGSTNFPSGGVSASAAQLVDSNGNVISFSGDTVTDTLGRNITVNARGVSYKDSNGTPRSIGFNYSTFPSSVPLPSFSTPAVNPSQGVISVGSMGISTMLSSVVLPDGLTYTFQYNEYGEIVEISYPSGGYTRYGYQGIPNHNIYYWTTANIGSADNREVVDKYTCPSVAVAAGATTPSGYIGTSVSDTCPVAENHTHYGRPTTDFTIYPVTVTDPNNNQTIYGGTTPAYSFGNSSGPCGAVGDPFNNNQPSLLNWTSPVSYLEPTKQIYQGSTILLRTIVPTYQGCLKTGEATTLSNGLTSGTTWVYDTAANLSTVTVNDEGSNETYNVYSETDNLITKAESAFGSGAPGQSVRKTEYSYLSVNPVNSVNYQQRSLYILNRLKEVKIEDASNSNKLMSDSTYEYDSYQGGITASGAVQHGTASNPYGTSYTTRGNVTAVNKWLDSSGGLVTTRNYQFDDAGNVLDRIDPRGYHTRFSYQDSWSNSGCWPPSPPLSGNAAAYVTTVMDAMGYTTTYAWNSCSGTLGSVTDPNQQTTTFSYDLMDRRILALYPDTGQTCIQYSDAPNTSCLNLGTPALPIQIAVSKKMNASQSETTRYTLDGLSRSTETNVISVSPNIEVDTQYDAVGNVGSVSNPYYTGTTGYGVTQYQWDALGRKVIQNQQDSSFLQWCYDDTKVNASQSNCSGNLGNQALAGSTIDYSDEAGSHSQQTLDALGRLAQVMELGNPSLPLSLETDYTYDSLGNLNSAVQHGVAGETPRSRSFTYDSLSRLVTSQNPETGTICYGQWNSGSCVDGYDANGNLRYKTDARGRTISYQYDPLNRIINKSASDGSFNYTYLYSETGHGYSIGRLTTSSNNINGGETYSYDSTGRVSQESYCVPTDCSLAKHVSATYDLAGNIATLTYPDGRQITNGADGAGRLASVTYTGWNGNGHNSPYLTVPQTNGYDPASHLTNATMGNNVAIAAQYDNRERLGSLAYGPTTQVLWGKTYGYWPNSNLQSTTDSVTGIQRQFGYDSLNRLTIAQDFIPNLGGASGTISETASSCTTGSNGETSGASQQWTNEDDSNGLQNPKVPGGDGWIVGSTTVVQNSAVAPDGSMSAATLTANSGSPDSFISDPLVQPSDYYSTSATGSVWIKSLTGNQNLDLFITELTANGSVVVAFKQVQLTGSWQQYQLTADLPGSFSQMVMQIGGGGTLTSGKSIAIWDTKLEDTGSAGPTVTNFLPYSQQFAKWSTPAGGVTDNAATAPDGTQTAASFTGPNGVGDSWIIQSVANPAPFSGQQVTGSVWIRSTTATQNLLLTLIETGASGWSTLGLQTVSLSGDWQRFQVSGATQSTLSQLALQIGGGGTLGSGQSIQVWGGQMELAGTAGPYIQTGATAVSRGTNLTNLLPYSQQLSGPSWGIAAGTRSSSAVTAPDGSATGNEITANTGSTDSYLVNDVQNPALYDGATVTGSVFLKAPGGSQSIDLFLFAENGSGRTFLGIHTVQLTSTWQRFSVTGQLPNGLTRFALQVGGGSTFGSGQVIDVWGSQLELASTAGPYIATSALPVVVGQELKNILPNSQQLSGPSWGVANGSIATNSGAAPDGSPTAATLTSAGGSTDSFVVDAVPNPSYYDGQTMTASVYLRVPSGSLNTNIYMINVGDSGFGIAAIQPVTVTSAWQRFQVTGSNQNGLTTFELQVGGGSTIGGGQTLQIWGAQMVPGTTPGTYGATSCTATNLITGNLGTLATDGLNQVFSYDSFGNLLQNGSFNNGNITANNQFYGSPYDAAGNLLSNGFTSFTWDAESKLTSAGGSTYIYDANGDRVEKQGVGITDTFYFGGKPIARLSAGQWTDLIYGPNGLLAEVPGTESASPIYRLTDHLGNSVDEVGDNGLLTNPMDYTPFGQVFSGSTNDPYLFTGKERDAESGLDYMDARYYGSSMGRFMSPDPVFATVNRLLDPQQWNMYSYGRNNPLSNSDPTGLDFNLTCSGNSATCQGGLQGQTTTDANGKSTFTATDVDMNKQGDVSAGYHDQFGNQYTGTFDQNNGVSFTNTATGDTSSNSRFIDGSDPTTVNGSGSLFSGTQGVFNSNCGGSCEAKGSLSDLPGSPGAVANAEKMIGASLEDKLNFFGGHGKSTSYRTGDGQLTHVVDHAGGATEIHFEGHPPGRDVVNFVLHQVDAIRDFANHQSSKEPPLP